LQREKRNRRRTPQGEAWLPLGKKTHLSQEGEEKKGGDRYPPVKRVPSTSKQNKNQVISIIKKSQVLREGGKGYRGEEKKGPDRL